MTGNVTGSVMVVGAGIAGIQASLDLADAGYLVYLVEKDTAIGGVMAQLDKTFPTNDCSMCIISPKLVEAGRHLNIELLPMTSINAVNGSAGDFTVTLTTAPRFIDMEKCTACGECDSVCPVELPNPFDEGLSSQKAAFKRYPQAMPSAFAIDKGDRAPCKLTCPAGLNVQGYVQMVKQGNYKKALEIIMEQLPLPGVLGRICPHECENACRRCEVDEPIAIRDLKRLAADQYDARKIDIECAPDTGKKVAIIGSGPAGLSCAYHLARKGITSTIFEALPKSGGMLRVGIPDHRLPPEVLDRDIEVITQLGVEIKLDTPLGGDLTIDSLLTDGFDAVFLALGAHKGIGLGIPGEEMDNVRQGVDFLRELNLTGTTHVGKHVAIIGGGNVAIDVARSAVRMGAETATILYRRTRAEMPAWEEEIVAAEAEGVKIIYLCAPLEILGQDDLLTGLKCMGMKLGEPDKSGRRRPVPIPGSEHDIRIDQLILAIGQRPDTTAIDPDTDILLTRWGTTEVDEITLETHRKGVFAGGDMQTGPGVAIAAIAAGMETAESIERYLAKEEMKASRAASTSPREQLKTADYTPLSPEISHQKRSKIQELSLADRQGNFNEVALGLEESQGQQEANRCLNCGYCSECMACVDACLAGAVDHAMTPVVQDIHVGAIILSPGFTPFNPKPYKTYGYGTSPNVVTSIEFERLLSASGPHQGHLVRPSDETEPRKIAWLQCVGSRDINQGDHSYCSGVCCMYANKQAVIAKEHSERSLDTAIFFMDMRTHGKEFDKYNIRAEDENGVRFIRSRIHSLFPMKDQRLRIDYATESGSTAQEVFDMVVLSVGLAPCRDARELASVMGIELNSHQFAHTRNLTPVNTTREGIFVCGAFQEPKDIPMSVMEASATATMAARMLSQQRWSLTRTRELPPERDFSGMTPRIGVFVCNCGINIGGIADVPAVRDYAATLPYVIHVEDNLFTCSQDTQEQIKEIILEKEINRVVVASCSPRTHEALFQETIRDAGLNKYLFEMANIRDQNTWVHMNHPEKATQKAKDLVRMAVAKAAHVEPLHQVKLAINKSLLVVGGGIAGMEAALSVAQQGLQVWLVEREECLGGVARELRSTWQGEPIQPYLKERIAQVQTHEHITVFFNTQVKSTTGSLGHFITTLSSGEALEHGATVIATGGKEDQPREYCYGEHPHVLTHLEMDKLLENETPRIKKSRSVVFIQCVGSRNNENPYCSKVCCTHSLKSAMEVKTLSPLARVYILYRDIRSYGFREDLYQKARGMGIIFIRYDLEKMPTVKIDDTNSLKLTVEDHVLKMPVTIRPDFLVLASGIVPHENKQLFGTCKIPVNDEGFLVEAHAKLRPVDFASDGLFVAGLAHFPKPVEETIAQAMAAAARAMRIISRDDIMVGGIVATVEKEKCAVCLTCVRTCPYEIPYIHEEGYAVIDPGECHGCGLCVSECPAKAITLNHFTDRQILAKTHALFNVA